MQWPWVRRKWADKFIIDRVAEMAKHICDHRWKVVSGSHRPASRRFQTGWFTPPDVVDELLNGSTTVVYECERCGIHKTEQFSGRVDIPGFTWGQKRRAA